MVYQIVVQYDVCLSLNILIIVLISSYPRYYDMLSVSGFVTKKKKKTRIDIKKNKNKNIDLCGNSKQEKTNRRENEKFHYIKYKYLREVFWMVNTTYSKISHKCNFTTYVVPRVFLDRTK